jgi:amino acid transporter
MPKKIWLATIAIIFFTVLGGSVIALEPVHAVSDAGKEALKFLDNTARTGGLLSGDADAAPDAGETGVLRIISNIINVLLGFVGIIFFIQLFWAGIRWMTSAGNEEVVKEAKQTIKTAVIGIVVVLSAFLITNFVLNQIKSVSSKTEPQSNAGIIGSCKYAIDNSECVDPGVNINGWNGIKSDITFDTCEAQVAGYTGAGCTDEYLWTSN